MMIFKRVSLVLALAFSTQALADQSIYDLERESKWTLDGGIGISQFSYAEKVPAPLKSEEAGTMAALNLQAQYQSNSDSPRFKFLTMFAAPSLTYTGTTQMGAALKPHQDSHTFTELEFQTDFLLTSSAGRDFTLYGFSGLGYHFWGRGKTQVINGALSIREDYSWLYLPLGVKLNQDMGSFFLGANALGRIPFLGRMTVRFSEVDSDLQNGTVNLGSKPGARLELPAGYNLSRVASLTLTPFYEYSAIGESNVEEIRWADGTSTGSAFLEPASTTYQYGAAAGLRLIL